MKVGYIVVGVFLFAWAGVRAQEADCTLSIAGKDSLVITEIFQLNESQRNQMGRWISDLNDSSRVISQKLRSLFEEHPQQTEEDLMAMSAKFNVLKERLEGISRNYDRLLLGLFNQRQYQRYLELCEEVQREPMAPLLDVPHPE